MLNLIFMNFLAHIYLSGENDLVRIGNFVGDWIKGNEYKKFHPDIQKGILLHRSIDYFTDNHPTVRQSKSRFSEKYHKYSGIIIDILYDHFLAKEWDNFSCVELPQFTVQLSECLISNMHHFSKEIQEFIPRFMNRKWIESYVTIDGIEQVLKGMTRHTSLPDKTDDAIRIFTDNYTDFRNEFYSYFPLLINYIEEKYKVGIRSQSFFRNTEL